MPVGTLDRSLGFPAPPRDVRPNKKRAKQLLPFGVSAAALSLVPMDRDRGDEGRKGKL